MHSKCLPASLLALLSALSVCFLCVLSLCALSVCSVCVLSLCALSVSSLLNPLFELFLSALSVSSFCELSLEPSLKLSLELFSYLEPPGLFRMLLELII